MPMLRHRPGKMAMRFIVSDLTLLTYAIGNAGAAKNETSEFALREEGFTRSDSSECAL